MSKKNKNEGGVANLKNTEAYRWKVAEYVAELEALQRKLLYPRTLIQVVRRDEVKHSSLWQVVRGAPRNNLL